MRILNRRDFDEFPVGAEYIGRPSVFGNPFEVGKDGDRDEVISKFRKYFHSKIKRSSSFKKAVLRLLGKDLVCWCSPKRCHGQVIIDWLRSREQSVAKLQIQREQKRRVLGQYIQGGRL